MCCDVAPLPPPPLFLFETFHEGSALWELYTTVAVKCLTVLLILIKAVSGQSCRPQRVDWPNAAWPRRSRVTVQKVVWNGCMKIFKVSHKSTLAPRDICLRSSRASSRRSHRVGFVSLFFVAVFLALAAVCCARFIFEPLPHSSGPCLEPIFSSSQCLCFPVRAEMFIRVKSEADYRRTVGDYRHTFKPYFYLCCAILNRR